jgi:hypothetical protein
MRANKERCAADGILNVDGFIAKHISHSILMALW